MDMWRRFGHSRIEMVRQLVPKNPLIDFPYAESTTIDAVMTLQELIQVYIYD